MKKIFILLTVLLLVVSSVFSASAKNAAVIYDGESQKIKLTPGTKYSTTDLFSNFKDIMPGDTLTQKITVKNDASNKVKVKIYIRSLGGRKDSKKFLSQLGLRVSKSKDNDMPYMFLASASKKAQLSEWVCLGTLYSGGKVNLNVILDVPIELDNKYQNEIGYLDWEFKIEEFPIENDDPKAPQTGDMSNPLLYFTIFIVSLSVIVILLISKKRKKNAKV